MSGLPGFRIIGNTKSSLAPDKALSTGYWPVRLGSFDAAKLYLAGLSFVVSMIVYFTNPTWRQWSDLFTFIYYYYFLTTFELQRPQSIYREIYH